MSLHDQELCGESECADADVEGFAGQDTDGKFCPIVLVVSDIVAMTSCVGSNACSCTPLSLFLWWWLLLLLLLLLCLIGHLHM